MVLPPGYEFFQVSKLDLEQIFMIRQALETILVYVQVRAKMSLVVHHLIVFYKSLKDDEQPAYDMLRKLKSALQQRYEEPQDASEDVLALFDEVETQIRKKQLNSLAPPGRRK